MNEAKYSFNVKFNLSGFDCQFTVRSDDDPGINTLIKAPSILDELGKLGAVGERRWEAVKNGSAAPKETPKSKPKSEPPPRQEQGPSAATFLIQQARESQTAGLIAADDSAPCVLCGVIGQLELIGFVRGDVYKMAWKCQACKKWIPNGTES